MRCSKNAPATLTRSHGVPVPALDLAAQAQHLVLGADVAAVVGADGDVDPRPTVNPSSASLRTIAPPIAPAAPVTSATRSLTRPTPRVSATIVTNVRYAWSGSPSENVIVRVAVRSTPRIAVAASAMSAVRNVHLDRDGELDRRRLRPPSPSTAARAPARISSHAFAGCRLSAAKRETDRLTTTAWMPGMNGAASSAVAWSPVIEGNRHAVVQGDQRVQARLAGHDAR